MRHSGATWLLDSGAERRAGATSGALRVPRPPQSLGVVCQCPRSPAECPRHSSERPRVRAVLRRTPASSVHHARTGPSATPLARRVVPARARRCAGPVQVRRGSSSSQRQHQRPTFPSVSSGLVKPFPMASRPEASMGLTVRRSVGSTAELGERGGWCRSGAAGGGSGSRGCPNYPLGRHGARSPSPIPGRGRARRRPVRHSYAEFLPETGIGAGAEVEARQVEAGEAVTTVVEEVASSRVGISYPATIEAPALGRWPH